MQRLLSPRLLTWKNSPVHPPLILQGVRQCGKTWLLKEFGATEFQDTAYFNFEQTDQLASLFEHDLDPGRIITELGLLRQKVIIPGTTLLILDEIQTCPRAFTALKYFAEQLPTLHIAAAGSLLGIAIARMNKNISFPVGKVITLTLYPLNFEEYLLANGDTLLHSHIQTLPAGRQLPSAITQRLEELYRWYLITGGMPAVVNAWIETKNIETVETLQENILSDYERDFIKYAPAGDYPKLTLIWKGIPLQLAKDNQKFVYSHIRTGARARDLEDALSWLLSAGLIYQIVKTEQPNIPLLTSADLSNFKIYLADVGLLRKMSGFPASAISSSEENTAYIRGILAENFVLTELIANHTAAGAICFWKSSNTAEVDYLIQYDTEIIPIEVKSGTNTRSKSLREYRKRYHPKQTVRTSIMPKSSHTDEWGEIHDIPLYLLWNLKRYLH